MEKTQHTPGPWHNFGAIVHHEGQHVAHVCATPLKGEEMGTPTERANARLIAAAPALLEAATKARALLSAIAIVHEQYSQGPARQAMADLHHAIVQATGQD